MGRKEKRFIETLKRKTMRENPLMEFSLGAGILHALGPIILTDLGITDMHAQALKNVDKPDLRSGLSHFFILRVHFLWKWTCGYI